MLLGTVGDTFADSGALMRTEECQCYVTGRGETEFLRVKPEKHIRAQLDVSPLSASERPNLGQTCIGMSQRPHQRYGGAHIF